MKRPECYGSPNEPSIGFARLPRVRIGHRVMFLLEDAETWVRSQREGECSGKQPIEAVDHAKPTGYHRNPLFVLPRGASQ